VRPEPPKKTNNSSQEKSTKTLESLSEAYRKLTPYLNIGTVWAISVIFFTWIGWLLDHYWDTEPWMTVVGAILGVITGFYHFFKVVSRAPGENDKNNRD
jgi:F0F1-type ATP synthase assembly protein I